MHNEVLKADFTCLRGLVVVELKCLVDDGKDRLANLQREMESREDWPRFYGNVPIQSVIKNLSDPEKSNIKVAERAGRTIVRHLEKANDQLKSHTSSYPRKNLVRLVFLVNEDNDLYSPLFAGSIIQDRLVHPPHEGADLGQIDAVVYLTERHLGMKNNEIALPMVCVEGRAVHSQPWKVEVINWIQVRWAEWNKAHLRHVTREDFPEFVAVENIPDKLKRHELWRLDYRREPYLKSLDKEHLQMIFEDIHFVIACGFIRGCPIKFTDESTEWAFRTFTHFIEETNSRGLPITVFSAKLTSMKNAASRLGCPTSVLDWLTSIDRA